MISRVGVWRDRMWPDGWTAVTADGKRSAQFEHTLLVTDLLVLSSWLPHWLLPLIVIVVYYRGRFRQVSLHLHCIWVLYLGISSHCSDFSLLDNGNFMYNRPCSIAYLFFCWLYCSAGDRNWSRSSYHKVAFIAEGVPLAKWQVLKYCTRTSGIWVCNNQDTKHSILHQGPTLIIRDVQ